MRNRIGAAIVALALGLGGALVVVAPANAEDAPPTPEVEVVEETTVIEEAPAIVEPEAVTTVTVVDPTPYVLVAWNLPGDVSDPIWPQTFYTSIDLAEGDLNALDGQLVGCDLGDFQVDLYNDSAITTALIAGGHLDAPNNPAEDLAHGAVKGDPWKYVDNGECPPPPPPTNAVCTSYGSVHTTDLTTWDLSASRSQSTTELTATGLALTTFEDSDNGSPDQRKAAGYYSTDFALKLTGDVALDWTGTSPQPGGQLKVDLDNDGSIDGTLVFEPVYGANLWLASIRDGFDTTGAPTVGGGGGSINGTINAYLAVWPDAHVKAIGYSLGSGVTGAGEISSITAGCVEYTFGLPVLPPVESGQDVTTDTECVAATFTTTTKPWTITYSYIKGVPTAGAKVYGATVVDTRPATVAELDAAECPLPEEPEPSNTVTTTVVVDCEADTVTTTTTGTRTTWALVDRVWVSTTVDTEPVVEVTAANAVQCPPVELPTPSALASTGVNAGLSGLLGGSIAGAFLLIGGALIAYRRARAHN